MMETRSEVYDRLDAARIIATAERLQRRVSERFPGSGLAGVAERLLEITRLAEATCREIARPQLGLRLAIGATILLLALVAGAALIRLDPDPLTRPNLLDVLALLESGINDLVFGGLIVVFLISLEHRFKRAKALKELSRLRAVAHVIDMHQLTKDPDRLQPGGRTASSPTVTLSARELSRYLDYCSEMLSICGKVAALHLQELPDAQVLAAVQEIESLTTGLSQKIWQELDILDR